MGRLQEVADWITTRLNIDPVDISSVSTFLRELLDNPAGIANQTFPYIYGFTSGIISFVEPTGILSVVTSIYLLADKRRLLVRCRKISYTIFPYHRAKRIGERMHLIGDTFANIYRRPVHPGGECSGVLSALSACSFSVLNTLCSSLAACHRRLFQHHPLYRGLVE